MTLPAVGASAPEISLASTSGETVSLASFRGKKHVLLAFFPLAFSPTCTEEVCGFRDDYDQFARHDLEVIPISVDSTWALKEFRAKHNANVHMLSDFHRTAATAYGVLIPEKLFAKRSYFLIDKSGILRWSYVEEHNGLKRTNAELLAEIAKLD